MSGIPLAFHFLMARDAAEFEESKHPRDESGKFSESRSSGSGKSKDRLKSFSDKWSSSGVRNFISVGPDDKIKLHDLVVPKDKRGTGMGSKFMQELTDIADENGQVITLTAAKDYGTTSLERLKEFYEKFGFVRNKGRNTDFAISDNMYRLPKGKAAPSEGEATESTLSNEELLNKAYTVAKFLNYPKEKIKLASEDKNFELNGKTYSYAGSCDRDGNIELFPHHLSEETVRGITAHEIEHGKFNTVLDRYLAESAVVTNLKFDHHKYLRPSGEIRPGMEEELRSKVPVYVELNQDIHPEFSVMDMAKDDGVSDYSREWWDAWNKSNADTRQAMHETLAEMSRIEWETGSVPGSPRWRAFYKAVNRIYKKLS